MGFFGWRRSSGDSIRRCTVSRCGSVIFADHRRPRGSGGPRPSGAGRRPLPGPDRREGSEADGSLSTAMAVPRLGRRSLHQERAPGLHDRPDETAPVASRIALLALAPDRVSQGQSRPVAGRAPRPNRNCGNRAGLPSIAKTSAPELRPLVPGVGHNDGLTQGKDKTNSNYSML